MSSNIHAYLRHLHITPRKTRLMGDMIRGLSVEEAQAQLMFAKKRARVPLLKLLESAIANAAQNHKVDKEKLYVREITIDKGPVSRRWMPRARGSASRIEKKTSHVSITLGVLESAAEKRYSMPEKRKKETHEKEKQGGKRADKPRDIREGEESGIGKKPEEPKKVSIAKRMFRRKSV